MWGADRSQAQQECSQEHRRTKEWWSTSTTNRLDLALMSASLITPYYYCGLHLFVVNTISGYHGGVDLPSLAESVIASFLPSWQPPLPFVGTTPDSFHANLEKDKYMIGERPPHPRALREGRVSLGQRQAILQSSLFSLQYDETLVAGYRGRCLS
ncbi:hypothetical protein C0Q70_06988 [Pomacea canaliculata]|uniref:Uncharacterized protein n=1 Tax=Pomacea canaliculata TaxID=400727 RepID=A0A2T7PDS8_POMCA|nr:hypothetical protein C0Q70_06988 [Pomacea canaliculata]